MFHKKPKKELEKNLFLKSTLGKNIIFPLKEKKKTNLKHRSIKMHFIFTNSIKQLKAQRMIPIRQKI